MLRLRAISTLAVFAMASACAGPPGPSAARPARTEPPHAVDRVTVPLHIEGNRPVIDVTFRKPDGTTRTARFVVDTGGGSFLLVESLAKDLGLTLGKPEHEEGSLLAPVTSTVHAFVGELPLDLDPGRILVEIGKDNILPPVSTVHAEGLFPGHVLAHYHVVFDYPRAIFTLARPGALAPVGTPMAMPVSEGSRFPRTEIQVDGVTHGMLLDTGASFTMVSEALLTSWGSAHPDWERHAGAFGEAATLGGATLETLFVPGVTWGANALGEVGVTSQREGTFEKWMSSMMTAPVIGSLAGNVLKRFRIELDYANQKLYLSGSAGS